MNDRSPLAAQTGVSVYQFIVDRIEEQRREEYPRGHEAYLDARTTAHDLEKDFAEAVRADERDGRRRSPVQAG